MTVEIIYSLPRPRVSSDWQVNMSEQIESNRGFLIKDIERELRGTTLVVRVDTTLSSDAVDNMLSDIEAYLETGSKHIETKEV